MSSVTVNLDLPAAKRVKEISVDGKESYVEKPSHSARLQQLTQQIDFSQLSNKIDKRITNATSAQEVNDKAARLSNEELVIQRPWDSVQSSIRSAIIEISAVTDLLKVAGQKKYVVMDPVKTEKDPSNAIVQLLAKKKNLAGAAGVLGKGSDEFAKHMQDGGEKYYANLAKLRQNWKLRRIGNRIIGDLTAIKLGTAATTRSLGIFEVSKHSAEKEKSFLDVILGSHLKGRASINISLTIDDEEFSVYPTLFAGDGRATWPSWHKKLKDAQNILFCKILFSKLVQESYQSNNKSQCRLMGTKLEIKLADRTWLSIIDNLCHDELDSSNYKPLVSSDDNHVFEPYCYILEHALQSLLQDFHKKSNIGNKGRGGKKRASQKDQAAMVKKDSEQSTILWSIVPQIEHMLLRKKLASTIDSVACSIREALICVHWHTLSCCTFSEVTITISQKGRKDLNRNMIRLTVGPRSISGICANYKVLNCGSDVTSALRFIESEVHAYLSDTILTVGIASGWHLLRKTRDIQDSPYNNSHFHIILLSPNKQTLLFIHVNPTEGITFYTKVSKNVHDNSQFLRDDLTALNKINWNNIHGTTLSARIRLLLAALA